MKKIMYFLFITYLLFQLSGLFQVTAVETKGDTSYNVILETSDVFYIGGKNRINSTINIMSLGSDIDSLRNIRTHVKLVSTDNHPISEYSTFAQSFTENNGSITDYIESYVGSWISYTRIKLYYGVSFTEVRSTGNSSHDSRWIYYKDIKFKNLPVPQNVTAIAGFNNISLHWDEPVNSSFPILNYSVYRNTFDGRIYYDYSICYVAFQCGNERILIGTTNSSNITDITVKNSTYYYYSVYAVTNKGEGVGNSSEYVKTISPPPASNYIYAYSNTYSNTSSVSVYWASSAYHWPIEETYKLYRYEEGDKNTTKLIETTNETHYTDKAVIEGVLYSYYVFIIDKYGESNQSAIANVTIEPIISESIYLLGTATQGSIWLRWNSPNYGSFTYDIYRSTSINNVTNNVTNNSTTTSVNRDIAETPKNSELIAITTSESYLDTAINPDTIYSYYIIAHSSTGVSYTSDLIFIHSLKLSLPEILIFTALPSQNHIKLSWSYSNINLYEITLYKASESSGERPIYSGFDTYYDDYDVAFDTDYYYRIKVVSKTGQEFFSNTVRIHLFSSQNITEWTTSTKISETSSFSLTGSVAPVSVKFIIPAIFVLSIIVLSTKFLKSTKKKE